MKIAGLIAALSPVPETDIAKSSRSSRRKAKRDMSRKETVEKVPELGDALADGEVERRARRRCHRRAGRCRGRRRSRVGAAGGQLVDVAKNCSPEELARRLRAERRNLDDESGIDRLERQRRDSRFRSKVDPVTGMYKFWGQLDPLSGLKMSNWIAAEVAARFAEAVPDGAPTDPVEKNAFLAALALHGLIQRGATGAGAAGRGSGRPEMTVVIDTRASDEHGAPVVDWGLPVDIPHEVLVDLFGQSDVAAVIVRNGAVLHAPGRMNLGRATRLASASPATGVAQPVPAVRDSRLSRPLRPLQDPPRGLVATWRPHRSRQPAAGVFPAPSGDTSRRLDRRARRGPHPRAHTARRPGHVDRSASTGGRVTAASRPRAKQGDGGKRARGRRAPRYRRVPTVKRVL